MSILSRISHGASVAPSASPQLGAAGNSTPTTPAGQAPRQRGPLESLKKAPPSPPTLPGTPPAHSSLAKRASKALRAQAKNAFSFVTKDGASRLDGNTPFTTHSRTGKPTTLRKFAQIKQSLERTDATHEVTPETSGPSASARKTQQELSRTMAGLRTQITTTTNASANSHGGRSQPAQALAHVDDAIAHWQSPQGQALAEEVGCDPDAFLSRVHEMAAAHPPAVAMAVSLALVSAKKRHDPDNATTLDGNIFSYLQHADLRAEIGNAKAHSETSRDTHILALRGALEQMRDTLIANRCTLEAAPVGESSSSAPSRKIDGAALRAFIQTVRDFPVAMRGAARHAPQALADWPGVHDSLGRFDADNAEAAAKCLTTLEAVADEIGAQHPAQDGHGAILVSEETAGKIRDAQDAMIAFVSAAPHLHEHDQALKHAESGRAVAWGALQHAATTNGFEAMLAATGNQSLSAAEQNDLRIHLQAGAAIATALKAKPTPEALIAARLAPHEAVSSAANFAQRVSDASAKLIHGAGPAALSAADKADLVAWRNGFNDDGPGSALSHFKHRFFKSLAWVDRMADDRSPALPSRHKSPLSAARKGMAQGDRAVLANEQKALMTELAKPEVTEVVHAVAAAMERVYGGSPAAGAAGEQKEGPRPDTLSDAHCEWIALRVALEDWVPEHKAARTVQGLVLGRRFSPEALPEAVEQRVRDYTIEAVCNETTGAPGALEHAVANVRQQLASVRLGFEDLHTLADFLKVEQGEPFKQAMEAARKITVTPPLSPADASPQSVRAMVVDYLKTIPGGNTVRFSRGNTAGLGTKGITKSLVNAKKKLLGIPVAGNARVDLRYEKGREAAVSMSYPVHAAELFIGTEKRHRGRIGAGCFFGAKLFKCCRAGINVDVNPYEHERTNASGVMVRIPRRTAAKDGEVRQLFSRVTDFMFSAADAQHHSPEGMPDADALFRAFASKFYAEHDLSISWIEQKTRTHRSEVSAGLGASVTKLLDPDEHDKHEQENGALGIGLGYAFEKQWHSTFTQLDSTGAYRIANLRQQKLSRHKLGLTTSAATTTGTIGNTSADLFGGSSVVSERGTQVKLRLTIDRDNLLPTKSIADFEFDSVRDYARYVEATKQEWVDMFAYPHKDDPDGGQAKGLKAVNEHLETARHLDTPYNAFFVRRALTTDAASTLNQLQQLSLVTPQSQHKLHEQIAASYTKTINAPGSWLPIGLRAYEKYNEADGFNVNAGLRVTQSTGLRVERQIVFDTIDAKLLKAYEAELKAKQAASQTPPSPESPNRVPAPARPIQRDGSSVLPLYHSVQGARAEIESEHEDSDHEQTEAASIERQSSAPAEPVHGSTHAGTSEIESVHEDSDHEQTPAPSVERRNPSLAELFAQSPQRSRPADTRTHLEHLKQQMDAKAGIAPPAKKASSLSRLFGQSKSKSKPQPDARPAAPRSHVPTQHADTGRSAPAMPLPRPEPTVRKTSRLPTGLRNLADTVTARSEKATAKKLSATQLDAWLQNNQHLSGRQTRAVQREAAKRAGSGRPQPAAQPQTARPAHPPEAPTDAETAPRTSR